MEYRTITNTDLKVSKICLGTMNMGQFNTEEESHEQLDCALSAGVNFIDTAEMYPVPPDPKLQGTTETYIGNWFKKTGKRNEVILASKASLGPAISCRDNGDSYSRQSVLDAIEGSLTRLGVDCIDLYQIHRPVRETNFFGPRGYTGDENPGDGGIEETLTILTELVKEGKIRYIGVSNETAWGVHEYLRLSKEKGLARIVTIQNQYSLLNRTFEVGLSEFAMREGVELLAYSPLSKGVLSGKYIGGVIPKGSRFDFALRDFDRYNPEHAQPAIEAYAKLAKENDMEPAELALAFVNSRKFLASNIIGAHTMEQLKMDINSIDIALSDQVLDEIQRLYTVMPDPCA